ncbi:MAG: arginine--tRNA ligase [Marinifilaceae bacterium]|jgi:arginyl-tRNA synthetase|nr:arginine--tRNA ligase [Marinifilaceae bacterium]
MKIEEIIIKGVKEAVSSLYGVELEDKTIQIQKTRREFEGDLTVVVFPFLRFSKKSPEDTANQLGEYLNKNIEQISAFNVVKGFLNLSISKAYWINILNEAINKENYGFVEATDESKSIMIEYSSPNTNKPLHLGHIRNNLLGYSVAQILKANGHKVIMVNLVNDRGIHICKSMLAWEKFGNGETPESTGIKGDHLVGKYYVKFDQEYKKEVESLKAQGVDADKAKAEASLLIEAQEMLRKWEAGDEAVVQLWKTMNSWVLKGFETTYKKMGISFDKIYFESETYKKGKEIVLKGLDEGVLYKKDEGSVWANLESDGLDHKLLLRKDGTSVYMTQDIGTAWQRFTEYNIDDHLYVVGNEQNYHFQVLALILGKLGYKWSDRINHLSYGMVELPEGKMKSREGTVVDADDLMAEMVKTAKETSEELGKLDDYSEEEANQVFEKIAMGALKYFILKVDPKKNMMFNPKESIDFNGNTGPFIQYTYARIQSVLNKSKDAGIEIGTKANTELNIAEKESYLLQMIANYPNIVAEAGKDTSPALISNFVYDLVKEYNQFYHEFPIAKEEDTQLREFRLILSKQIGMIIKSGMSLLGIDVVDRM